MNEALAKILSCTTLPTLPAVALRVIELTSDEEVSLHELARAIENDQGLAARVVRTVNSSFYGLRQRCASIDKALVLLGLSPVKSLALGFSLVRSLSEGADGGFDYRDYWRRGLVTAVAGKLLAERVGFEFGDEVFLAGLLQDIGMVAMHRALGAEYGEVLRSAGGKHRELAGRELAMLDLQHADIGAMLAQRWRLPRELYLPVRYHERPSAAPSACADHVRCVGLGNLVHDVLTEAAPGAALKSLYQRGRDWYNLEPAELDGLIGRTGEGVKEMSGLLSLEIDRCREAEAVLAEAGRRAAALLRLAPLCAGGACNARGGGGFVGCEFDPLTGAVGPQGFERAIRGAFGEASERDRALALVEVAIDGQAGLASVHGEGADIEAVVGVTALLKRMFEGHGGVVCRVAPDTLVVLLPGTDRAGATALAQAFLGELGRAGATWTAPSGASPMRVSASVGIAALDVETRGHFTEPGGLLRACAGALRAARDAGGGAVRAFRPRAAA